MTILQIMRGERGGEGEREKGCWELYTILQKGGDMSSILLRKCQVFCFIGLCELYHIHFFLFVLIKDK